MAGTLKREAADVKEELTLMRALRDMNLPKFVFEDVPLFQGLISDLFPNMDIKRKPYEKRDKIVDIIENKLNLITKDEQINKVVQLYETMETRHTTMVVGPTGAGKSSVIEILKNVESVTIYVMNPKSITVNELYGVMDIVTREWKDGLLSKIFKIANEKPQSGREELRWIMFDGDVDAVWVENMNSVMDDNKLLTLINGDRIRLERFCKMLFEVYDLQYASPATISRCGMVYVDPKNLGYDPYWNKWMKKWSKDNKKEKNELIIEGLTEFYEKYVHSMINLIYDGIDGDEVGAPLDFLLPRTNLNLVNQLTRLLDNIINEEDNSF